MQAKAQLAQMFIATSWESRQVNTMPGRPWPWADTRAIGTLEIPRLGIKQFIMQDASGESLAFGPGRVLPSVLPSSTGHAVIAGHRDSHFSFLRDVSKGDIITTSNYQQQQQSYKVSDIHIINVTEQSLNSNEEQNQLTLITCYPFDSLVPGGPLRLIITALPLQAKKHLIHEQSPPIEISTQKSTHTQHQASSIEGALNEYQGISKRAVTAGDT